MQCLEYLRSELILSLLLSVSFFACSPPSDSNNGLTPEEALVTFELPPGFQIEQVAAEPLISDPVAMEIDEEGRMYVVEMHGYPLDLNNTGKVILLTDEDGDGKMDTRSVFAEGFKFPSGVMRWKQGIIVTDAPNVYYLEDSNQDGQADIMDTLLTGFALTNPQYLVNNPLYGLDNWIYLAHGDISETDIYPKEFGDVGSDIYYPEHPGGPMLEKNGSGKIVRFRPDKKLLETTAAYTQFGHTFDAWGHHFLTENDKHIFQDVIEEKYLNRNPNLVVSGATAALSDHGDACEVFPITKNPQNQLLTDAGVITSACGITVYEGNAFPEGYNQNITLVCEPVSNLIHADALSPNGAVYTASRKFENKAFLASTDLWFRPVNQYIGPDGALYVLDYYREIVEHPEWMSDEMVHSGKLYNGIDQGRIYRISRTDAEPIKWTSQLNLNELSDQELVERLNDPNIWMRRNAQRLLVDRDSEKAVPLLEQLVQQGGHAVGRLHALWTLQGMNQLNASLIIRALGDDEAGVRENAIKLAELHLEESPSLEKGLLKLGKDSNSRVRFQLLCTLGSIHDPASEKLRNELLFNYLDDDWMQIAALSALKVNTSFVLEEALKKFDAKDPAYGSLVDKLALSVGLNGSAKSINGLIARGLKEKKDWQSVLLDGLNVGLHGREQLPQGIEETQDDLINACLKDEKLSVRRSARHLLSIIGIPEKDRSRLQREMNSIVEDDAVDEEKKAEAVYFLTLLNPQENESLFKKIIEDATPYKIQLAAIKGLDALSDTTVATFAIHHWASLSPGIKDAALNTFTKEPFDPERIRLLLDAIDEGKIGKSDIDWPRTIVLMRDLPEDLKDRARDLLEGQYTNREVVVKEYKSSLKLKGNPEGGKAVYQANCQICHSYRGEMGLDFGPDLGTVKAWTAESILINILDPNKSIAHGYTMWVATQKDGTVTQGIIVSQGANAVTLKTEKGEEKTISKNTLTSFRPLGVSAMPVGLEEKIDHQEMADLIAFIKGEN